VTPWEESHGQRSEGCAEVHREIKEQLKIHRENIHREISEIRE
jgi:hypothetical protein